MRTAQDCLSCFYKQAENLALHVSDDPSEQADFVRLFKEALHTMDLTLSPPAIAGQLYPLVEQFGVRDPFAATKQASNKRALELLPMLREKVHSAADPLRTALNLSIIGNYMDVGADLGIDWEAAIHTEDESAWGTETYPAFADKLTTSPSILILGDNCGEIALDTLLVSLLTERGCNVTYAVRGRPILNDATLEDAETVGMTKLCRVITSGVKSPGTVLELTAPGFIDEMHGSDMIISKGQGNFEALYNTWNRTPGIFYAFKAKCSVVAEELNVPQGTSMFLYA